MSHQLISLNADLLQLQNEGYELEIFIKQSSAFALVHNVPYVSAGPEIKRGTLVSTLLLQGEKTIEPTDHVMYFVGDDPCDKDGNILQQIQHAIGKTELAPGLFTDRSFSNKPSGGYSDYHHKFTQYIRLLSHPAKSLDSSATAETFKPIETSSDEQIFEYLDTNATRCGIAALLSSFQKYKVGIVGLGGTGSYILDFVAKTPVAEIHLFDGDKYSQHNAFRSPGATSLAQLVQSPYKAEYFKELYGRLHRGIRAHVSYIHDANLSLLEDMNFVFISIDSGEIKRMLFDYLLSKNIPFIDVGLGVENAEGKLSGIIRTTYVTTECSDHVDKCVSMESAEGDLYSTNIQIAELNAFNAVMAVIKWKKHLGFYHDFNFEINSTYTIDAHMLLGEEPDAA